MKKYKVTFTETYIYTKEIEIDNNEEINEVIHTPNYPLVYEMTKEQFGQLNAHLECEHDIEAIEDK